MRSVRVRNNGLPTSRNPKGLIPLDLWLVLADSSVDSQRWWWHLYSQHSGDSDQRSLWGSRPLSLLRATGLHSKLLSPNKTQLLNWIPSNDRQEATESEESQVASWRMSSFWSSQFIIWYYLCEVSHFGNYGIHQPTKRVKSHWERRLDTGRL